MRFLLNSLYLMLLVIAAPRLMLSAVRHGKYRDGLAAKLWGRTPKLRGDRRRIWVHAVSVGEINLLRPIVDRITQANPDVDVVISTTTKTGFELAKKKYHAHTVFYCPLDFSWAVRNAFRRVAPSLLVLVELELWPNLLSEADRLRIPVAIINGRLSDKSFASYHRIRWLVRKWLSKVALITAQSPTCGERFVELGADPARVHVVGSIKFDGARTDRNNPLSRRLAKLASIQSSDQIFVAGSTQAPEEALAVRAMRRLLAAFPSLRLILVPRHPERGDEVAQILNQSGIAWQRRTQMTDRGVTEADAPSAPILLVDTVGELSGWWGCAHVGFVGGSIGTRGGQNMIEPAAFGVATCFGPNTRNFRDVVRLFLSADAARIVQNETDLVEFIEKCLADPPFCRQLGQRARQLVISQSGAADQTLELLAGLMSSDGVAFSHHLEPSPPRTQSNGKADSSNSPLRRGA